MKTSTLQTLHHSLHAWYAARGRHDLPWRHTRNPYKIYLSEIMLQQTQVATVLARFYDPFLARFPSLLEVANAPLEAVLEQWQGLGYYTRARNLHACALTCKGILPSSPEALYTLPGIGKTTAHAILCFAYKQPFPILEANVKRILARLNALETPSEKELWEHAWALLDRQNSFDYNQALMDLGALVCTAKNPSCATCPLGFTCKGIHAPARFPAPKTKKLIPHHRRFALVFRQGDTLGLTQHTERFLHGLWGFPQSDAHPQGEHLGTVTHTYSHFKLTLEVIACDTPPATLTWFSKEALATLPLSSLERKILALF